MQIPVKIDPNTGKMPPEEEVEVLRIRDLKERMKQDDVTEKMILDDIRKRDIDNISLIYQTTTPMMFPSLHVAFFETVQMMRRAYLKLGIKSLDKFHEIKNATKKEVGDAQRILEIEKLHKGVLYEHRRADKYGRDEAGKREQWRTGHYFYKSNEIAYFISNVTRDKSGRVGHLMIPGAEIKFLVTSNVPGPWKGR